MATLLHQSDADTLAEIESARETLTRLGARPYLDRLEAALHEGPERSPGLKVGRAAANSLAHRVS